MEHCEKHDTYRDPTEEPCWACKREAEEVTHNITTIEEGAFDGLAYCTKCSKAEVELEEECKPREVEE